MSKTIIKIIGVFMSPITVTVAGVLFLSWGVVFIYSKLFNKDESIIESKIEHIIEQDIENVLNLPSGTMDGKLDFMVQPQEEPAETKENK
jgi:hypothetical protein